MIMSMSPPVDDAAKTKRINLLVTEREKAAIEASAAAAGLSTSELLRRAALSYDPSVDAAELAALAREFGAAADRLGDKIDAVLDRLAAPRPDRAALAAVAARGLAEDGDEWPFD